MNSGLRYDADYAVEVHDHVEVRLGGDAFEGQVTKLHARMHAVTVRYADHTDCRRDGTPKQKSARVPVGDVDLTRRDG